MAMKCQEKTTGGPLTPHVDAPTPHQRMAAMYRQLGDVSSRIAFPCDTSASLAATISRYTGTTGGHIDSTRAIIVPHGHRVERLDDWTHWTGGVCAVRKDLATGELEAAADPRRWSRAMGW